ncbi:MAG: hypothetical protein WA880_10680 [Ornithinimicrobium sp.]
MSRSSLARTTSTTFLSLITTIWAGALGYHVVSVLFGCATVAIVGTAVTRGMRRASAVIAGADDMIAQHRRQARHNHSASV